MIRPLLTAILLLMALAVPAGAQITGPETVSFEVKEFSWKNERGSAINTVTLNNSRLDTLPEISIRVILQDTLRDSTHIVWNVTVNRPGYPIYFERDTLSLVQQMHIPLKSNVGYIPDSLFSVIAKIASPVIGSELRIQLTKIDPDQGYFMPIVFASDTVRGTKTDTSDVIYLGQGTKEAVFGFMSSVETAEVVFEAIYNTGEGWGPSNPPDTLAAKTWTDDVVQNTWAYRDVGELLNSTFCRIIRRGQAAADTGLVRQNIRLPPR